MEDKLTKDEIIEIIRDEIEKTRVHQSMVIPGAIKDRHLDFGERTAGDLIYLDSEKRLKFLNAGIPNTGWAITNKSEDKTLSCSC